MRLPLILALGLFALPPSAAAPEVVEVAGESTQAATDLLFQAANYQGADSTASIATALQRGESIKNTDKKGNTALILLSMVVEGDARYKTDETFRKALQESVILLIQNGADCLVENNAGCNALFFLHSDPELIQTLTRLNLIPRELSIRIPHEDIALFRHMQLRLAQAGYSTNPFSLSYLNRRYCKPAYPRVLERLKVYLNAETSSLIPTGALQDTLAFLRMADEQAITDYINKLPLWEHGEHFLEEIPERLLVALCELNWDVKEENLHAALNKLESMLPVEEGDMIDCYAAYPMGKLLEMMVRKDAVKTQSLLHKYTTSHDPDMAYTAYRILLQQKKLPLPEPGPLSESLNLSGGIDALPNEQKLLLECAIVDEAMRHGNMEGISLEMLQRVQGYFRDMKLDNFAYILSSIIGENGMITPEEGLNEAFSDYREEHSISPRIVLARYILEHPDLFATPTP